MNTKKNNSKRVGILLCAFAAGFLAAEAHGQATNNTGTNAPIADSPGALSTNVNFFSGAFTTAVDWFGNDTGYRWNGHGYLQSGVAYQNQVNVANSVEAGYYVTGGTNGGSGLTLAAQELNAGIGGIVKQGEMDALWRIPINDVSLQAGLGVGDDFTGGGPFGAVVAEAQKKVAAASHLFVRAQEDIGGSKISKVPLIMAGAGISF